MSYNYENIKPALFTDDGQRLFLKVRDKTKQLLKEAGAARLQEMAMNNSGSSWDMMACVDRLVELGEIRELKQEGVCGQHRVFIES